MVLRVASADTEVGRFWNAARPPLGLLGVGSVGFRSLEDVSNFPRELPRLLFHVLSQRLRVFRVGGGDSVTTGHSQRGVDVNSGGRAGRIAVADAIDASGEEILQVSLHELRELVDLRLRR